MKLVCDESVEREVVEKLCDEGHQVIYIAEMEAGITDDVVLSQALEQQAPLVTCDKDFGDLVFRQSRASRGVVLVRLAGLPNNRKAEIVSNVFFEHGNDFIDAFSVVTAGQVRIRKT